MTPLDRLGIVGVGLIGGSIGLAARERGLARELIGVGRTRANLDVALERGCVDAVDTRVEAVADCDLVILATPIQTLARNAADLAAVVSANTVVTDAGSVKGPVVRACSEALGDRARFVGSHPIAGTEHSGAAAAVSGLFVGKRCILTPTPATDPPALALVRSFWDALGMEVDERGPDEHDRAYAALSHVPHVLSFSLMRSVENPEAIAHLAGSSFRDMTRVAGSKAETWVDIFSSNREELLRQLTRVEAELRRFRAAIDGQEAETVAGLIAGANTARAAVPASVGGTPSGTEEIVPAVGPLVGAVVVPGDKGITHRGLILGALARGRTEITGMGPGRDNASTIEVLRSLGVRIDWSGDRAVVHGRGAEALAASARALDCGNSGSTMRMISGVLAGRPFASRLDGDESLRARPMQRVVDALAPLGAKMACDGDRPPLRFEPAELRGARIDLPVASAQLKTAVLLAGLSAAGRTSVTEPARSRDHTERLLPLFGVPVEQDADGVLGIDGPATLSAARLEVPGDPSAAAFWMVAGSVVPGSEVTLRHVGMNPTRTGALDVLRRMGAEVEEVGRRVVGEEPVSDLEVRPRALRAVVVEGEEMLRAIDELPILAVAAALAEGVSVFRDAEELRKKETDRLAAMAAGLTALGVTVREQPGGLEIEGMPRLRGGRVEARGDHRIAMAFAVGALRADGPVVIEGADAIPVSDPRFLETLDRLRGAA